MTPTLVDKFDQVISEGDYVYVATHTGHSNASIRFGRVVGLTPKTVRLIECNQDGSERAQERSTYPGSNYLLYNPRFHINYTHKDKIVVVSRKGEEEYD